MGTAPARPSRRERLIADGRRAESDACRCGACRRAKREWAGAVRAWQSIPLAERRVIAKPELHQPHGIVRSHDGSWRCLLTEGPACRRNKSATKAQLSCATAVPENHNCAIAKWLGAQLSCATVAQQIHEAPLPDADHVCPRCTHATAELAERERVLPRGSERLCASCRLDLAAAAAAELQDAGISLGWGRLHLDDGDRRSMLVHVVRRSD